jgi:maltose O-acetyltransferase
MIYKIFRRVSRLVLNLYYYYKMYFLVIFKPVVLTVNGDIKVNQTVRVEGMGVVEFNGNNTLGVYPSPYLHESSIYLEARSSSAKIIIDKNVVFNNNAVIIADKSTVHIGEFTLIGTNFTCFDSNFHSLNPKERLEDGPYTCKPVTIGRNVFIGSNVTILRGATIGDNTVIGAGCIVSGNIPKDSIVSISSNLQITQIRHV